MLDLGEVPSPFCLHRFLAREVSDQEHLDLQSRHFCKPKAQNSSVQTNPTGLKLIASSRLNPWSIIVPSPADGNFQAESIGHGGFD